MTALDQLKRLLDSGQFHHATYRCIGTVWEGLWFYRRCPDAFRGYESVGCVNKMMDTAADMDEAHALVGSVHVGAYGGG